MKTKNLNGIWCKKHILILFLVVAAALLGVFFFLRRGNGKAVILLPASRLDVPDTVCYYQQKDPRWAKDHLGQARDTMASSGCLVCALAAGLEMQDTSSLTPGELNRLFSEAQVYTDSGAVIWNRIPEAVPGAKSYVAGEVRAEEIDRFLANGICPVVKVRVGGTGAFHWVLLVGADENGYLCMDPLQDVREPVPLEKFQNQVYAMRAVYRE